MRTRAILIFSTLLLAVSAKAQTGAAFNYGSFGKVSLYFPAAAPKSVVLFLSGDGGWEKGVVEMATALQKTGALVAGIDVPKYLKRAAGKKSDHCFYPAGDLEELAKAVEEKYGLKNYLVPLLGGYSSGATLVYTAIAQAPEGTFGGAISLGFCPDLECAAEPCQQHGLHCHRVVKPVPAWQLDADPAVRTPWYVLHGELDQCCTFAPTKTFLKKIPDAHLIPLPKVGHGFAVGANWMPQFLASYTAIVQTPAPVLTPGHKGNGPQAPAVTPALNNELPLIVTEAQAGTSSDYMAVLISGDGGWKDFDQGIANDLAAKGIPVVGLNALKYFWTEKSPETASWDLTRLMKQYREHWGKKSVVLIGYSFGGEVLPFMFNLLNDADKNTVHSIVMISPGDKADFEFHFSSWANQSSGHARPIRPELEKMQQRSVLFLFGSDEDPAWVRPLIHGNFALKILEGGHHFDGDTAALSTAILEFSRLK